MLSSIQYVIIARKPRIAAAYQRSSLDFTNSSHTGAQHAARNTATIGEYKSAINACDSGGTKNEWPAARSAAVASASVYPVTSTVATSTPIARARMLSAMLFHWGVRDAFMRLGYLTPHP